MKAIINIEDAVPIFEFVTQLNLAISVMESRNGFNPFKPLHLRMNKKTYDKLLLVIDPHNIFSEDCNHSTYRGVEIKICDALPTDMMIVDDIEDAPIYSQQKQDP